MKRIVVFMLLCLVAFNTGYALEHSTDTNSTQDKFTEERMHDTLLDQEFTLSPNVMEVQMHSMVEVDYSLQQLCMIHLEDGKSIVPPRGVSGEYDNRDKSIMYRENLKSNRNTSNVPIKFVRMLLREKSIE